MNIYLAQVFRNDVWTTVYASTYLRDAQETYQALHEAFPDRTVRLATATHSSLDFLAHDARDFEIIERHER